MRYRNNLFIQSRRHVRGMTLIELLVAMVVGLVVVLATVAALTVARRGFTTVDAAAQLRDSGRFAAEMIQRIGVQAGYKDVVFAATELKTAADPVPNVSGFNNSVIDATDPLGSASARSSTVEGYGSDILVLRYQPSQLYTLSDDATLRTKSDLTMIDCAGNPVSDIGDLNDPNARYTRMASVFHVAISQGEPSLMCTYADPAAPGTFKTVPLIQGVEQFQVLYGVDGVTPGTAPLATAPAPNVPNAFLRANQLTVSGDAAGTHANWRRVRSIRVGMVLRAAPGSSQTRDVTTLYPFGTAKDSASGDVGGAFKSTNDVGTEFTAPADGRLRQTVTFTIHLRNDQGL